MSIAASSVPPREVREARLGIRTKLFVISLVLIGAALIAAEIYLTRALEKRLIEGVRSDLLVRARLVAQRVSEPFGATAEISRYDALADELGRAAVARVTLVRRDGVVVGDSEVAAADLHALDNHATRPEVAAALSEHDGVGVRLSQTVHDRLMYMAVPILRDGQLIGAARVALPLDRIDDMVSDLRKTLAAAALFALGVAAVLSWLAAELVSGKLRQLTVAAKRMAAGNLALRTRIAGRDEIAALAVALDQLARNLSRTLEALRNERDLLNGILSGMAEGVLLVGSDGRIVTTNPALRAMLLIQGEPVGKNVLHVIRNADLNELLNRARAGAAPETELEISGLRPRRLLVRAAALHEKPGSVLAVLVDVTELRRLEFVRRDFVANASHELRSPLTTIRAAAETLESAPDDAAATRRFVDLIARNAERLQSLVDDMLELSRIEAREVELEVENLDLEPVVERVAAAHAHRAQLKRITLRRHVADTPTVRADRRALEHVLGNLLDNALKYCPNDAVIELSAHSENGTVRVVVRDDGPGIASEHLPRLFERFYRVDPGRSRELGGTGLGLAIVKHLVEAMGGTVTVESGPEAGSTFSFTLPAGA